MHTEYPPLTHGGAILRGLVSGGLIAAGLVSSFDGWIRAALVVLGLFVFIDSCLPDRGQGFFTLSVLFAALFGGGAVAVIVLVGGWLVAVPLFLAAAWLTAKRILDRS